MGNTANESTTLFPVLIVGETLAHREKTVVAALGYLAALDSITNRATGLMFMRAIAEPA